MRVAIYLCNCNAIYTTSLFYIEVLIIFCILFTADRAFLSWLVKVPSEAEQMRARQVTVFTIIQSFCESKTV